MIGAAGVEDPAETGWDDWMDGWTAGSVCFSYQAEAIPQSPVLVEWLTFQSS